MLNAERLHAGVVPTPRAVAPQPSPGASRASLRTLISPKWMTVRARAAQGERGRVARWAVLGVVGALFWGVAFGLLYRVLRYFAGVDEIGALLAGKLLGLLLLSFSAILLLSNIIAALSSFFLAKDLELLMSSPVDWLSLYVSRLFETLLHSSWMVVLLSVPMLAAYGMASTAASSSCSSRSRGSCRS